MITPPATPTTIRRGQQRLDPRPGRIRQLTAPNTHKPDITNPVTRTFTGQALVEERTPIRTAERPADASAAAGDDSLLPEPDDVYTTSTANTREDLARLAPVVSRPDDAIGAGPDPDASLDDDLADWYGPACQCPRLELLGPVTLWGPGPTGGGA